MSFTADGTIAEERRLKEEEEQKEREERERLEREASDRLQVNNLTCILFCCSCDNNYYCPLVHVIKFCL